MSSPLDSHEVAALMQAIRQGRGPVEATPAAAGTVGPGTGLPALPYDLTSQGRILGGPVPGLDSINERIASRFGKSLAARTRLDLRIAATPATLLKYGELGPLLGAPATLGTLTLGPGHGGGLVILEGALAHALVCGALGDRKASRSPAPVGPEDATPPTTLERSVLQHLLGGLCEAMRTAWSDVLSLQPRVLRIDRVPLHDPGLAATAGDIAVLSSFVPSGDGVGAGERIHLVLPWAAVAPARKWLASPGQPHRDVRREPLARETSLARELAQVEVTLRVQLGRTRLRLDQLLELAVGDVLSLDTHQGAPLPVFVQGRAKLTATARGDGGNIVEIRSALTASKAVPA